MAKTGMTGPELIAKVIHRLLVRDGYLGATSEGDTIYILKDSNPEYFKIKVTVEKEKSNMDGWQKLMIGCIIIAVLSFIITAIL